jgi:hypothetical protein
LPGAALAPAKLQKAAMKIAALLRERQIVGVGVA